MEIYNYTDDARARHEREMLELSKSEGNLGEIPGTRRTASRWKRWVARVSLTVACLLLPLAAIIALSWKGGERSSPNNVFIVLIDVGLFLFSIWLDPYMLDPYAGKTGGSVGSDRGGGDWGDVGGGGDDGDDAGD